MIKLVIDNFYNIKGYGLPLKFKGIVEGDYICDLCNKSHYFKGLPKLYWFEVNTDNWAKFGTTCIKEVLK